jgi:hypothetical protein
VTRFLGRSHAKLLGSLAHENVNDFSITMPSPTTSPTPTPLTITLTITST